MTKGQIAKLEKILQRWKHFQYGLGQADKDIKFLLRMLGKEAK